MICNTQNWVKSARVLVIIKAAVSRFAGVVYHKIRIYVILRETFKQCFIFSTLLESYPTNVFGVSQLVE